VLKPNISLVSPVYSENLHKNDFIAHPVTQGQSFGYIPEMESRGITLPAGHIYLRAGLHRAGYGKGYGIRHIWAGHANNLPKHGCKSIDEVAFYVAAIIVHKTPIYCEFVPRKNGHRLTVLRNRKGCVILEPMTNAGTDELFYSVVTAYPLRQEQGTLVGHVTVIVA